MSMPIDDDDRPQYSVVQFFPDETYEKVLEWVGPEEAVKMAAQLAGSVGARIGTTRRIIITDGGDHTCFQWEFGKGVTFK
jgi:hypothetical protein